MSSHSASVTKPAWYSEWTYVRWCAMTAIAARYVCTARKQSGASKCRSLQAVQGLVADSRAGARRVEGDLLWQCWQAARRTLAPEAEAVSGGGAVWPAPGPRAGGARGGSAGQARASSANSKAAPGSAGRRTTHRMNCQTTCTCRASVVGNSRPTRRLLRSPRGEAEDATARAAYALMSAPPVRHPAPAAAPLAHHTRPRPPPRRSSSPRSAAPAGRRPPRGPARPPRR